MRACLQDALQDGPGEAAGRLGHGLGRPLRHDPPAGLARLRPQVDDPVGRLDHVQVVLDHDHRVAQVDQAVEHVEQLG